VSNDNLKVSVVIPVFNDLLRLESCLNALVSQTYPRELYEIVVVDNASTEDVKSLVEKYEKVVYLYEQKPGSYAARNKGLSVAKGEIVAFTDSDCVPANDWIEQGVKALQDNPGCGLVGGAITLFYKNPNRLTGVEVYESLSGFPQQKYIEEDCFGATANVFTFRKVIDDVGEFNTELKSGGDAEWGKRVAAAGYPLCFVDCVRVEHPARSTYAEHYKKTIRVMSGLPYFRKPEPSLVKIVGNLLKGLLVPPVSRVRKILGQAAERSTEEKVKLALVVVLFRYVWVLEGARLQIKNRHNVA
jgi:glycosyltransferase involved in cell wall biosynthesis